MVRVSVSDLHLTGKPSARYSAKVNRSVKVLGFVQFGGPKLTVGRTIFEMWLGL